MVLEVRQRLHVVGAEVRDLGVMLPVKHCKDLCVPSLLGEALRVLSVERGLQHHSVAGLGDHLVTQLEDDVGQGVMGGFGRAFVGGDRHGRSFRRGTLAAYRSTMRAAEDG